MKKKDCISILIPDGQGFLAVPVINCLASSNQFKIYLLSNLKYTPMRFSRFVNHFSYSPKTKNDEDWINTIDNIVENHGIDFIMPVSECSIRKLILHKSKLKAAKKLMLLPELDNFDTANDKALLSLHLHKYDIPHPKGCLVSNMAELNKMETLNFPVISKPTIGYSGGKHIHVFKKMDALKTHFKNSNFLGIHIIQEYIEGYDIDCSVLCKAGEILAYTIQKGIVSDASDFSPSYAHVFVQEPKLFSVVEKLMKTLNWSGIAHIDLRFDENAQQFKVIEINPRFWLSLEASLHAGFNFPELSHKLSIGQTLITPKFNECSYWSLKGLKLKQEKKVLFRWKFLKKHTGLKFFIKDPVPIIYRFFALRFGKRESVHDFSN